MRTCRKASARYFFILKNLSLFRCLWGLQRNFVDKKIPTVLQQTVGIPFLRCVALCKRLILPILFNTLFLYFIILITFFFIIQHYDIKSNIFRCIFPQIRVICRFLTFTENSIKLSHPIFDNVGWDYCDTPQNILGFKKAMSMSRKKETSNDIKK